MITSYPTTYPTTTVTRAIGEAGVGGGRIPKPGDYLTTAPPPTFDYLTDESGNRLTA